MIQSKIHDLLIIGGGINGAGIACDAAGRGLSVILLEQYDLGSGTSSHSTKLIHGGLRYLEYGHFGMVRKALAEREVLLKKAPHLISPLRFVMPHIPSQRSSLVISLGLLLYDHLGQRRMLPASKRVSLKHSPFISEITHGFAYSDCWVDDARLVIANAQAAYSLGANIKTRHRVERIGFSNGFWIVEAFDSERQTYVSFMAKAIVNATGPWISQFISHHTPINSAFRTKLVQGSHIIVNKQWDDDKAYVLQLKDKRIMFVIPYERDYQLIGTTEFEFQGDPAEVKIKDEEIKYLLDNFNQFFKSTIHPSDIISTYAGVRPLISADNINISALSRDYDIEIIEHEGLPLINVFGGKLTTYRQLSEDVVNRLAEYFPKMDKPWTAQAPLPGGDIPHGDFDAFFDNMRHSYPWLAYDTCYRYARLYGTRMPMIIAEAQSYSDLGRHFGKDCYEAELLYLVQYEWARTSQDILVRRTKLGLSLSPAQQQAIDHWLVRLLSDGRC